MHMPRFLTTATRLALFSLTMIVLVSAQAGAATCTWVGTGLSNNFSDAGNWDAVPAPGDDLVFSAAAFSARPAPVNDRTAALGAPFPVGAINIYAAYTISGLTLSPTSINDVSATGATISLPLTTAGAAVITVTVNTAGATLSLSGLLSGAGPMTFSGPGMKRLNGSVNNTLAGLTSVAMGTLILASTASEAIAGPMIIDSGATVTVLTAPEIKNTKTVTVNGTLDLSTATGTDVSTDTETIGGLSGTGTVALGSRNLGCTAQAATTTFSGGFTGTGGFRQSSSGTQVLSGTTSTNTGATTLAGGSIHIWGSQALSPVTVTAGTLVLANDCTVGNVTISGGASSALSCNETISALNMHGTTGTLAIGALSTFQIVTKGAAATLYTNVSATAVNITGATLTVNTATYTPAVSSVMRIIDNTGVTAVIGTFAGLAEGATVTSSTNSGTTFTISYVGGTGNDVTLTALSNAPDTTAPIISVVVSGSVTASSATVTWTTNEASDSQVEYGPTTAYGSMTTLATSLVTSHSVALSGLTASTMYHYRVLSQDAAGNLATGADHIFTTAAASGTTTGTATAGTATAGTTTVGTTASGGSSCGLGGGGLALLLTLGLFAARRRT